MQEHEPVLLKDFISLVEPITGCWIDGTFGAGGYTISSISKVDKLISKLPRFSKDREMLERFINTQSTYMQLDETGRIVLSHRLKEKIGIGDEAIFAGMGEKFQIWEPKNYQNELNALDSSFKKLSEDENPFLKLDQLQD